MSNKPFLIAFITILYLVPVQCNRDTPTHSAENCDITGTWILISENGVASDSDNVMIFVIDQSYITTYVPSASCFYTTDMPYSISGNKILGDDFTWTQAAPYGLDSTSTICSVAGDTMTYTVVTVADEISSYILTFQRYSGAVPPADWPDEACPGPGITGTWKQIERNGEYVDDDRTTYLVIASSSIASYQYQWHGCHTLENTSYLLLGNRILGEGYSSTEGPTLGSTTYSASVDSLTFHNTVKMNTYGDTSTFYNTIIYKRYSGEVPPQDWPSEACTH